jgi:hypothetical protein
MNNFANAIESLNNCLQNLEDYELAELIQVFRGDYDSILPALRSLQHRSPRTSTLFQFIPYCIGLCISYSSHVVYHYIWDESARRFVDIFT